MDKENKIATQIQIYISRHFFTGKTRKHYPNSVTNLLVPLKYVITDKHAYSHTSTIPILKANPSAAISVADKPQTNIENQKSSMPEFPPSALI